eukprot:1239071-Rhodomonas_salina.2
MAISVHRLSFPPHQPYRPRALQAGLNTNYPWFRKSPKVTAVPYNKRSRIVDNVIRGQTDSIIAVKLLRGQTDSIIRQIPADHPAVLSLPVTQRELDIYLAQLRRRKQPGDDGVPNE